VGARLRARQELHEKECQMALQDRVQEETNEKKNALEAYIYSLRGKLAEQLAPFASESERSSLSELLDNLEARTGLYLCTSSFLGWCCGLLQAWHAA